MIVENEYNDKDLKIQQRAVKSDEVTRKVPIRNLLEKNLANSKLEAFLVNHHEIIGRVSQTLKILLLDCFHNNRDLPTINKGLISSIYMTVTHIFKTNQGRKRKITPGVDVKVNDLYENKMIAILSRPDPLNKVLIPDRRRKASNSDFWS